MDPVLGIGVYEYWSSALARKYKYVKFIEDKRVQGISKIIQSRDHGYLAPTFARLALVYTYWDYNKMDLALVASKELQQSYPNNIMNLEALGQLYHRKRQFDKAQATFQQVTAIDPRNYQVYFWMGNLEMRRGGNLEKARDHYKRFLADNTGNYYKAIGEIRLGDCYYHLGDLASAKAMWEKGYQSNPDYSVARLRHEGTLPRSRNARPTQRTSPSASTP
jgi:tetratricopeptide (TPR) repeat protein